jgi:hypothetical protein
MDNFNELQIDSTPPAPVIDYAAINHDLSRHAVLSRQLPIGYTGSDLHKSIKARLAANGITIK